MDGKYFKRKLILLSIPIPGLCILGLETRGKRQEVTFEAQWQIPLDEVMKQDDVTLDSGPVYHRSGKERRQARHNARRCSGWYPPTKLGNKVNG